MAKTRTVVWPRRARSFSLDSARSEADAAATGNSPPQPKPNSAWAAVRKAKTTWAVGPSAAVSSTPAACTEHRTFIPPYHVGFPAAHVHCGPHSLSK